MKKLFILAALALSVTLTGCISDLQMPDIFGGSDTETAPADGKNAPTKTPATTNGKGGGSTIGSDSGKGSKSYTASPGEIVIIIGETKRSEIREMLGNGGAAGNIYSNIRKQMHITKVTVIGSKGPVSLDARRLSMLTIDYGHNRSGYTDHNFPVTQVCLVPQ